MKPDRTIIEGIEACRPGSDDLHLDELADVANVVNEDPETRELYERTQRSDAVVQEAFHNVEVPEGLEDRLLACLGLAEDSLAEEEDGQRFDATHTAVVAASGAEATDATSTSLPLSVDAEPRSRRHLISLLALSLLLFVTIGAGVWLLRPVDGPLTSESILAEVESFHLGETGGWSEDTTMLSSAHPYSPRVKVDPLSWQPVAGPSDSKGMAYLVEANGERRATLYAFRTKRDISQLPLAPPSQPSRQGSDWELGVWRNASTNVVYVFVVEGPQATRRYGQYLQSSGIVAAVLSPEWFAWLRNPQSLTLPAQAAKLL